MKNNQISSKDELDELFVKEDELNKKLLSELLSKFLKLTGDGTPIFESPYYELPNAQKLVVYLLARKVLKLKNVIENEEIGPTEIANTIGLPVGSVKSAIHFTKGIFMAVNGKYKVPNHVLNKLPDFLATIPSYDAKKSANRHTEVGTLATKNVLQSHAVQKIKEALDRSKYPKMYDLKTIHDKTVYLLKIVKDEFNIDGLTPPEIAYLLTEIFRIPVTRQAVTMAVMDSKYLHRTSSAITGRFSHVYKVMEAGDNYISERLQ